MLKDLRNTAIFVICGLLIIFIVFFLINSFSSNEKIKVEKISLDDEIVVSLKDRLLLIDQFRDSYDDMQIDNNILLYYLFDNVKEEDYTVKSVKNKKIVCKVTNNIEFTSSSKCDVIVITNDKIKEIKLKMLNHSQEIMFVDFEYKGLECKNDGLSYYCLMKEYTSLYNDYSVIDSAFKREGKVVIRDYYLTIDISDYEVCASYYTKEYCDSYSTSLKPELDDDVIKENGVLYELTFVYGEFGYYLESVEII